MQENKFLKFLSFMWNPLSWVMEVAAIMALVLANGGGEGPDWHDFVGIICLLVINSTISFIEENNAGNAAQALMAKLAPKTRVVEARAEWMHELQKRTKEELERQRYYKEIAFLNDDSGPSSPCFQKPDNYSGWTFASEPAFSSTAYDSDTKKRTVSSAETEFVDKSVIIENPVMKTAVEKNIMSVSSPKMLLHSFDDDDDDDSSLENEKIMSCFVSKLCLAKSSDKTVPIKKLPSCFVTSA